MIVSMHRNLLNGGKNLCSDINDRYNAPEPSKWWNKSILVISMIDSMHQNLPNAGIKAL